MMSDKIKPKLTSAENLSLICGKDGIRSEVIPSFKPSKYPAMVAWETQDPWVRDEGLRCSQASR